MKRSGPRGSGPPPPADLRVRTFDAADGRRYATLWFSRGQARHEPKLTSAELEVTEMIRAGYSNARIARARRVAVSTVATQVRKVFAKFGVSTRAELVAHWMDRDVL